MRESTKTENIRNTIDWNSTGTRQKGGRALGNEDGLNLGTYYLCFMNMRSLAPLILFHDSGRIVWILSLKSRDPKKRKTSNRRRRDGHHAMEDIHIKCTQAVCIYVHTDNVAMVIECEPLSRLCNRDDSFHVLRIRKNVVRRSKCLRDCRFTEAIWYLAFFLSSPSDILNIGILFVLNHYASGICVCGQSNKIYGWPPVALFKSLHRSNSNMR